MIRRIVTLYLLFGNSFSQDYDGIWDLGDKDTSSQMDNPSSTIYSDPFGDIFDVTSSTTQAFDGSGISDNNNTMADSVKPDSNTNNEEVCECIPYYLCDGRATASKNKYGEGLIDTRIKKRVECPHYLLKCCDEEDLQDVDLEDTTPPPQTTPKPRTPKGCGYRTFEPPSIPKEDNIAEYGEFPWTVAIFYIDSAKRINYVCGGTLIHPEVVVTAAHCIKNIKSDPKIRAGEYDSRNDNEKYPHQDRDVASVIIHSQYNAKTLVNDIALMFLKTPVDLAVHVNVVCLPSGDTDLKEGRCVSNGWGRESFGKEGVMTKVDLPMVPRVQCQSNLRKTHLGRYFMLHESFVCAGGEAGKDTCNGDGGSPLVCPIEGEKDRYFQIGIVSWGVGCGMQKVPALYVNVPFFRKWIDEKLKKKNLNISVYQA